MAYKPPQKVTFSTTYTPKYMSGDFKSKKVPAPDQPIGLSISAYKIGQYIDQVVSDNNLREYKRLFEQIKILVKSVMKVLCERKFTIDLSLWREVNSIQVPASFNDTVITFPVQRYEYERWVVIFRSLIPSVAYPFNSKIIEKPLNTSQSIELISNDGSIDDSDDSSFSDSITIDNSERYEEWYETAIYAYQNLLLTSSSKKREMIDRVFQEANSNARNRNDRNKAHENRSKSINELKNGTYEWVNRIGHIVKHYGYLRIHSIENELITIDSLLKYSDLILMNGILNGSFEYMPLIDSNDSILLDSRKAYPKDRYIENIRLYRNKECISSDPIKERMFYDTIANLTWAFYIHHYDRPLNDLLHEFDIQTIVSEYLDGTITPQSQKIRKVINRLTETRYDAVKSELQTYNKAMVSHALAANIQGEPQQLAIVKLMAEYIDCETAVAELRTHPAKRFSSYHNTVAWMILFNIVPFDITKDETIFEPKIAIDIYIALLNDTKLNPSLIKQNMNTIKATTDALLPLTTGYAKYKLMDAFTEANNALLNS